MSASIEQLREDQRRTRTLLLMGAPCLAAFFAWWLPMFASVAPDRSEEDLTVYPDTWTLLGVGLDPGDGGLQTVIRVLALLSLALLALCVGCALATAGPGDPGRAAAALPWAATTALVTGLLLLVVTVQGDGVGAFGTDTVQPVGGSWLLVILPLWFLAARDAARRA